MYYLRGVIILPQKPQKPCGYPGCPELIREGRYCPVHKTEMSRQYNATRDPDFNQRYGRQWRKIRTLYISKHPLCEECEKSGRLVPATEVHHIIPLDEGGSNADENLQALCKPCHSRHTLNETRKKVY